MLNYQRVHGPEIDNENTGHQQYEYVVGEILGCNGNMSLAALGYIWIRWFFSPTVWGFFTHDRTFFFLVGHTPQHGHLLGIATKIYGAGHGKILYCLV